MARIIDKNYLYFADRPLADKTTPILSSGTLQVNAHAEVNILDLNCSFIFYSSTTKLTNHISFQLSAALFIGTGFQWI